MREAVRTVALGALLIASTSARAVSALPDDVACVVPAVTPETARTVAANNVVNSGAMVIGAIAVTGVSAAGVSPENTLLLAPVMCLAAAWLAQKLHVACD